MREKTAEWVARSVIGEGHVNRIGKGLVGMKRKEIIVNGNAESL